MPRMTSWVAHRRASRSASSPPRRPTVPSRRWTCLPGAPPTQKPPPAPLLRRHASWRYLTLASPKPIDEARKGEIRALLAPLTASLHASRNWEIAVTDELSGLLLAALLRDPAARRNGRDTGATAPRSPSPASTSTTSRSSTTPWGTAPATSRSAASETSSAASVRASDLRLPLRRRGVRRAVSGDGRPLRARRRRPRPPRRSSGNPSARTAGPFASRCPPASRIRKDSPRRTGPSSSSARTRRSITPRTPAATVPGSSRPSSREPVSPQRSRRASRRRSRPSPAGKTQSERRSHEARERVGFRAGPAGVLRSDAELAEDPAALLREPPQGIADRSRQSPAAAEELRDGLVPRQPRRPPPAGLAQGHERLGAGPGQPQRDAQRLGPGRAPRAPSRRCVTNSSGPPASSVVSTGLPDRNASRGTYPRSSPEAVTATSRASGIEREELLVVHGLRETSGPAPRRRAPRRAAGDVPPRGRAHEHGAAPSGACGERLEQQAGRFQASSRPTQRTVSPSLPAAVPAGQRRRMVERLERMPLNRSSRAATVCEFANTLRASVSPTRSISAITSRVRRSSGEAVRSLYGVPNWS